MLFSDVKGSTTFSEHLDPEEVMEIMDGAFDVLIGPITRYEGALARLMGDGILAFFGAPIAHEDDAERACRAALDIITRAGEYAARLEAERGVSGFNVRVGIHTGLVVVGEVGSDLRVEYTAMGDAVNTASRMETAAEPGTVLITEDTHRLIAPLFETKALGPVEVRGRGKPVAVYRVLAPMAVEGKPRGITGLDSPLVGREAEMQTLREALGHLQAGVGGIVTVVGEAGIGKSRLVAEVRKAATPLGTGWVEGRCLSYGGSIAYLPWVDMLHSFLRVAPDAAPAILRDALQGWVRELCPASFDDVYPYLGRMMSLPLEDEVEDKLRGLDPEGMKVLTFRAVETVVQCAVSDSPLVLVCEDLHWADPSSLELLEHLLSLTDRVPLLLVSAFRPYREHGCWRIREVASRLYDHRYTDMRLNPLSTADGEVLVGNLLEVEALPRPLRVRILDHAEGNPFYVEEVIRSLIDSEVIVYDETTEQWQARQRVEDIAIPDTLQGVLMARIDRLQEEARRVLQIASVIGRIFLYRILATITQEERELDTQLLTLQREEMIRQRARVPELEYIFKHHLTQDAAYNGLLRRDRRLFHRQVAEARERLFPDRIEEQLGLLAHHWERAGEHPKAIQYLRRAGEQAAAQFANAEAIVYFSRALELTPAEDHAGRYDLLRVRERVYDVQGSREAQRQDLTGLQEMAEAMDDDGLRVEVALREARYGVVTSDYPRAIAATQRAIYLARAAGDVQRQVTGHLQLGAALYDSGEYERARAALEQALALARAAGLRRAEAESLSRIGLVLWYRFKHADSRAHYEQALRIYREVGDQRGEDWTLWLVGLVSLSTRDYCQARALFQQRLRSMREIGNRRQEGLVLSPLGHVYHLLGDYDRARACYEESLRIRRETEDRRGEAGALRGLASLFHHLGDDEAALQYSQRALLVAREAAARSRQAGALTWLGHALMALGHRDGAVDAYREALALMRELGQWSRTSQPLAGQACVSLAQGDLAQAQTHVEEIMSRLGTGIPIGIMEPFRVYLTCYRVLLANGDPRAQAILETGHRLLQETAAKISNEEERRSYLENVAANREIVSAYALVAERTQRRRDVTADQGD